jgi:glycosyltransferase involved in cell wall biosynthesis
MTEYQSRRDASTLMSMADCYVSLHRSEGLGLTITEAMSLGVPVIATGYSGNLDFMDEWNTWRVPCSMVPVGFGAGGYPPGAQWAEPNLDEAARMMREVFENPRAAREKAARAQEHLLNSFSPESAGARMRRRLEKVWASLERR